MKFGLKNRGCESEMGPVRKKTRLNPMKNVQRISVQIFRARSLVFTLLIDDAYLSPFSYNS